MHDIEFRDSIGKVCFLTYLHFCLWRKIFYRKNPNNEPKLNAATISHLKHCNLCSFTVLLSSSFLSSSIFLDNVYIILTMFNATDRVSFGIECQTTFTQLNYSKKIQRVKRKPQNSSERCFTNVKNVKM